MQQVPQLHLVVRPNQLGRTLAREGDVDGIERVALLGKRVYSIMGLVEAAMCIEMLLALGAGGDLARFIRVIMVKDQLTQVVFERGVGFIVFEVFDLEKQEGFVVPGKTGPVNDPLAS